MSIERYKRQLSALQTKHDAVQQQLGSLTSARNRLELRDSIVKSWCDGFSMLLDAQLAHSSSSASGSSPVELLGELLVEESALLQQLPEDASGGGAAAAADAAPVCEQMATFKYLLAQPPVPNVADLTLQEFGAIYDKAVKDSSVLLHTLDSQLADNQADIEQEIADIWRRYGSGFNRFCLFKCTKRHLTLIAPCSLTSLCTQPCLSPP